MYPSEKSPNFGVFVKNFEEGIQSEDVQIIDKTIIVNPNQVLIINEGSELKFQDNADLIVYGNIQINGTKPSPVSIANVDNSSSSIIVINTTGINNISHTNFHNLSNFDNNFVGITGDPEKIFLLSKSWGILSQKIFLENGEYNIDHSSPVILLKEGKYVAKISHRDDVKKSLKIINKFL